MRTWTTFRELRDAGACQGRYRHLARALGGVRAYSETTPIPLAKILETNGPEGTEWAVAVVSELNSTWEAFGRFREGARQLNPTAMKAIEDWMNCLITRVEFSSILASVGCDNDALLAKFIGRLEESE